jgi:hypothetical protein
MTQKIANYIKLIEDGLKRKSMRSDGVDEIWWGC